MNKRTTLGMLAWMLAAVAGQAQLSVTVSPVKITGQKAVVPLALKNDLSEQIESARAAVFLLDEHVILRVRTSHEVAGQNQPPRGA